MSSFGINMFSDLATRLLVSLSRDERRRNYVAMEWINFALPLFLQPAFVNILQICTMTSYAELATNSSCLCCKQTTITWTALILQKKTKFDVKQFFEKIWSCKEWVFYMFSWWIYGHSSLMDISCYHWKFETLQVVWFLCISVWRRHWHDTEKKTGSNLST